MFQCYKDKEGYIKHQCGNVTIDESEYFADIDYKQGKLECIRLSSTVTKTIMFKMEKNCYDNDERIVRLEYCDNLGRLTKSYELDFRENVYVQTRYDRGMIMTDQSKVVKAEVVFEKFNIMWNKIKPFMYSKSSFL